MINRTGSFGGYYGAAAEVGGPDCRGNSRASVIFPREQLTVPAGSLLVLHLLGKRLTVVLVLS